MKQHKRLARIKHQSIIAIAEMIKFTMSLSADVKLAALYIKVQQCVSLHQALIKMGHPQSPTQVKVGNLTTVEVIKNNIE